MASKLPENLRTPLASIMTSKFPKSLGTHLAEITVPLDVDGEQGWRVRFSYDYETPNKMPHRAFFSVTVYRDNPDGWSWPKIFMFLQTPHLSRAIEIAEEYGTLSADHVKQIAEFGHEGALSLLAAKLTGAGNDNE
jgi:hypothetical protein